MLKNNNPSLSNPRLSNLSLSRREFLTTAAGAGGAMLLGPTWLNAASYALDQGAAQDPRVAQVLSKTIGIDMHNHVYPTGMETRQFAGRQPQGAGDGLMAEELKRSGFTAVCASFAVDFEPSGKPGDARDSFLHWLTAMDAQLEKEHMHRALSLKDLQAAHDSGRPTIIQGSEGAQFIEGRLERVEEVYKRGLRQLQLLHDRDDMVSSLGGTDNGRSTGGLTALGAQVVKECNRLGIVVDMAHASHETILGVLKVATQPIIVSHSPSGRTSGDSRSAGMMASRVITKEHAKVVADAGGVLGVWTNGVSSLKDFVEDIRAMVDAAGIDHVGIGTDSDLISTRAGQGPSGTNKALPDLTGGFFYSVVGEMLRQGFKPDEISKVGGGNYCRVFGKATAGHA
jgi:membrane dipeptidase